DTPLEPQGTWSQMFITNPESAPTPRFGHTAILDNTYQVGNELKRRMLVFGGIGGVAQTPADTVIYALTFDPNNVNSATWSQVNVHYTALKPAPRFDHSMDVDLLTTFTSPSNTLGHQAIMYGGRLGPTLCSGLVWRLWLYADGSAEWQQVTVA